MLAPHLKMTAAEFNKLTIEARRLAIDKSLGNFTEMMEAAGNTFSSKMGEAQSHLKTLVRLAGEPIFTAVVEQLSQMNEYLSANKASLLGMGKALSTTLIAGVKTLATHFESIVTAGKNLLEVFIAFKAGVVATSLVNGLMTIVKAFQAIRKAAVAAAAAEAFATGGVSALVGAAAAASVYAAFKLTESEVGESFEANRQAAERASYVPSSAAAAGQLQEIHFREMELSKSLFGAAESLHGFESLAVDSQQEILRRIGETYPVGSASFREAFEGHLKELGYDIADVVPGAKFSKPSLPDGPKKADVVIENARFDIKQNFAEGYDPDRIAAAFVDQLGAATMYRTQSAFSGQPGTGV
jgi:hypothetical protein